MGKYGGVGSAIGLGAGALLGPIGAGVGSALGGFIGNMFGGSDSEDEKDLARENMSRYGFQGVYQKFLQGESTRMKDEESKRIMRLATNLVPGQSNLRVNLAQQGLSGGASNVLAKQQREAGMDKAMETGFGAQEQMSNRLDQQFLGMTSQNEAMRFGASQDLMKLEQGDTENDRSFNNQLMGAAMGAGMNMAGMGVYNKLFGKDITGEYGKTLSEENDLGTLFGFKGNFNPEKYGKTSFQLPKF